MADRDIVLAWLNDAHAMENALIRVLDSQAGATGDYPMIQARIKQHAEQTRRHAELVEECVNRLGGSTSVLKTGMANVMGFMQGLSTAPAEDSLIKNALSDFAAENFEIASYTALILAARQIGDQETAMVCEQILRDEQEMAAWLESNLPMVVQESMRTAVTADAG